MSVLLEAALPEDLDALAELDRRCYTHPWTREHFRGAMADPARGRLVVLREPRPTLDEMRGIRAYCAVEVVLDEGQIHTLAVHPEHRRHGHGRRLASLSIDWMARRGARRILLEVRVGNQAARALYEALGFQFVALRRDYYREPREDALVLARNLEINGVAC